MKIPPDFIALFKFIGIFSTGCLGVACALQRIKRMKPGSTDSESADAVVEQCDLSRKYVRVIGEREGGFVVFEFSIGWTDMAVELVMPKVMFQEFCQREKVQLLAPEDSGRQ